MLSPTLQGHMPLSSEEPIQVRISTDLEILITALVSPTEETTEACDIAALNNANFVRAILLSGPIFRSNDLD